jgi:uncharacterized protein (DUF1015 family)
MSSGVRMRYPGVPAGGLTVRPARVRLAGGKPERAFVVYRLAAGRHRQLGVVVELAVDDYRAGRVRRHEATHPDRVRLLEEQLGSPAAEAVPVTLLHPPRPRLRSLLTEATAATPDASRASDDGVSDLAWIVRDVDREHGIQAALADVEVLYLADGHHRMAAAERRAARHRPDAQAAQFVLAALFPADEMRVLGFHRCVARPDRMSTPDLLGVLAALPAVERIVRCVSAADIEPAPGVVTMHLHGGWHRISLRTPDAAAEPRVSLDVVVLEEEVLAPLLRSDGDDSASRVTALPGTLDAAAIEHWCAEHDAIGFTLHPPGVGQIIAVADAGQVMPAKSTWFDPKPHPGLLQHIAET